MNRKIAVWLTVAFLASLVPLATASSSPSREGAVRWALDHIGSQKFNGLCLRFVRLAFNGRGASWAASPVTLIKHLGGQIQRGTPPRGALVLFGATTRARDNYDNPYGHIGISLGGGNMVHAVAWGRNAGIRVSSISSVPRYVGWAWAPNDWRGRELPKSPAPMPTRTQPPTRTPIPTKTLTPTAMSTSIPSVEVFGPMGFYEAWELINQDYLFMEFNAIHPVEEYCEKLISKANHPELSLYACEFVGVIRGVENSWIDGWVLTIPRKYKDMIWIEPNVMQHKDGPELLICGVNSFEEEWWIYETSSGGIRMILTGWETCGS